MKKIIIFGILSLIMIAGCRKSDIPKLPEITKLPVPLLTKDNKADMTISAQNPDSFSGKIVVGLYFPDGIKPSKFELVVIKNGNKNVVKTVNANITSFPSTVTVTGTQLKTLFGSSIMVGDKFDFGVNIVTTEGKTFLAFPPVGEAYGPNMSNPPGSSLSVRYEAICQFNMADFGAVGTTQDFVVVEDGWADYAPGTVIPVKIVSSTSMSFEYAAADAKPIIIKIDPATNATSVTKAVYGNYGAEYGDFSAESVAGSADNFVGPCELIVSVKLNHTVSLGSFGDYVIKLKKK